MNLLDAFIAIPLLWGAYKGFKRGLIFEVLLLAGLVIGLYVAFKFSGLARHLLSSILDRNSVVMHFASFIIVLAAILLVMILFARFLERILKITSLTIFNQLAGAVFGIFKFGIIVSVMLWSIKSLEPYWNFIGEDMKEHSLLYKPVLKTTSFITPALEDIKKEFKEVTK
ncbi:MAG: CvpA family protein [Bacteroidia bacterium]|nr:CvpA family protein [Bacteroidia bacterium]MCZ2277954.1 CvpA family protein [Bacteroidia bacterium]